MAATTDSVVRNEWIACGWLGQIAVGASLDTQILGQAIRITRTGDAGYEIIEIGQGGATRPQPPGPDTLLLHFHDARRADASASGNRRV